MTAELIATIALGGLLTPILLAMNGRMNAVADRLQTLGERVAKVEAQLEMALRGGGAAQMHDQMSTPLPVGSPRRKAMNRKPPKWVYSVLFGTVCVILVAIYIERNPGLPQYPEPLPETNRLSDATKMRIEVSLDITKVFISMSLAVIGGVVFILRSAIENEDRIPLITAIASVVTFLFSVFSIFFGHMLFTVVIVMLSSDLLPAGFDKYGLGQYICFLLSIVALVVCAGSTHSSSVQDGSVQDGS